MRNRKGFTLVEIMIVVAIIALLAAIAIPNFIAYRNKTFCSRAESDANGISASLSDYFAVPTHVTTPALGQLNNGSGYRMSGEPSAQANVGAIAGADPNVNITITVLDGSSRCPTDYQNAMLVGADAKSFWDGGAQGTYTKIISF